MVMYMSAEYSRLYILVAHAHVHGSLTDSILACSQVAHLYIQMQTCAISSGGIHVIYIYPLLAYITIGLLLAN